MAVLTREDFFSRLNRVIGTENSDESIAFIEDVTDTYNDLESRANNDADEWEKRYHELDKSWQERYRHRFFSNPTQNYAGVQRKQEEEIDDRSESITYTDLFK